MNAACTEYAVLDNPPEIACCADFNRAMDVARQCDQLILPPNYRLLMSGRDMAPLLECQQRYRPITYQYQIEKGSLLFLEAQAKKIYEDHNQSKVNSAL